MSKNDEVTARQNKRKEDRGKLRREQRKSGTDDGIMLDGAKL